jgi:hypothetical protein
MLIKVDDPLARDAGVLFDLSRQLPPGLEHTLWRTQRARIDAEVEDWTRSDPETVKFAFRVAAVLVIEFPPGEPVHG